MSREGHLQQHHWCPGEGRSGRSSMDTRRGIAGGAPPKIAVERIAPLLPGIFKCRCVQDLPPPPRSHASIRCQSLSGFSFIYAALLQGNGGQRCTFAIQGLGASLGNCNSWLITFLGAIGWQMPNTCCKDVEPDMTTFNTAISAQFKDGKNVDKVQISAGSGQHMQQHATIIRRL